MTRAMQTASVCGECVCVCVLGESLGSVCLYSTPHAMINIELHYGLEGAG